MTRLKVYFYSILYVLLTRVDSAVGYFYMSICHFIFSQSWHMKGLISLGIRVLVSLCVTFYLAYMFLAFFWFLMKFYKGDLHEVWYSHQTHPPHFSIRRSLLSHLALEGSYKNSWKHVMSNSMKGTNISSQGTLWCTLCLHSFLIIKINTTLFICSLFQSENRVN